MCGTERDRAERARELLVARIACVGGPVEQSGKRSCCVGVLASIRVHELGGLLWLEEAVLGR